MYLAEHAEETSLSTHAASPNRRTTKRGSEPQQEPPRSARTRLATLGNPGGDTSDQASHRIKQVRNSLEAGIHHKVFERRSAKTSDYKLKDLMKLWRENIALVPLRIDPDLAAIKGDMSEHNKFDWAKEISSIPQSQTLEILENHGIHH